MHLIIPMGGKGNRLLPHTLETLKPLIPILGQSLLERVVDCIDQVFVEKIQKISLIIPKGRHEEIQEEIRRIKTRYHLNIEFVVQENSKGTADAIHVMPSELSGPTLVVYADTIFYLDKPLKLDNYTTSCIFTQQRKDPEHFGVVKRNEMHEVIEFVEKPKQFISDEVVIGAYYFPEGKVLQRTVKKYASQYHQKEEYPLTDVLNFMLKQGEEAFQTCSVKTWLDFGTVINCLMSQQWLLNHKSPQQPWILKSSVVKDSLLIPPVYIGENTKIKRSIIGPYVSLEKNSTVENSIIENSILQQNAMVKNITMQDSLINEASQLINAVAVYNVGKHTNIHHL